MVKAANSLAIAGYDVTLVASEYMDCWIDVGKDLLAKRKWQYCPVNWHPITGSRLFSVSRIRHKAYREIVGRLPLSIASLPMLAKAACRVAPELIRVVASQPTDLVIGGTAGGLAVSGIAARAMDKPFALDLEDFHTAEQGDGVDGNQTHRLMAAIQDRLIHKTAFYTTSSRPIADCLAELYGRRPLVLHNVFTLPADKPRFGPSKSMSLKLLWFSQTVGPGRGLETVVEACLLVNRPIVLGLAGAMTPLAHELVAKARRQGVVVECLGTAPPDSLVDLCRKWDVGLAAEADASPNRQMCTVTNKMGTYLIAGIAIAASDTSGQREMAADLAEGAWYYPPGDAAKLAEGLRRWADDPALLETAKQRTWRAAQTRWHWNHPLEEGRLLEAVEGVIGKP